LGLSIFCWFVIAATQVVGSVRGARALAKFALVTFIAMVLVLVRSAFVPVALNTTAWSGIGVALMAARRPLGALVRVTGYVILLAVPMVVLALPQAYLMINQQKDVPDDPQLWGVGVSQSVWSISTAKYSTLVVQCKYGPVGFEYPMPLLSGLNPAGLPQ